MCIFHKQNEYSDFTFWPCSRKYLCLEAQGSFLSFFLQATVPESVPIGYSVLTVGATDVESNENISYRILSSSKEFSIDPMNGELFIVALVFVGSSYRVEGCSNLFQMLLKRFHLTTTPPPGIIDATLLISLHIKCCGSKPWCYFSSPTSQWLESKRN